MRSTTSCLHLLTGKEKLEAENLFTLWLCRLWPPLLGIFDGVSPPDIGVFLEPDDVGDVVLIQVGQPLLPNEFPIKSESMNVAGRKNPQELRHEADALFCVGVSTLCFLGQNSPNDGNGDLANDDTDGQEVDRLATEFPIGAIHRENVSLVWLRNALENKAAH